MKPKTKGAWIIHHTRKLNDVNYSPEFADIELAGKCGTFLSNLAASHEQSDLNSEKVNAIAIVSNVKKTELETIKQKLKEAELIDADKKGNISVLGVTTATVLSHTASIFENTQPNDYQRAALELSENVSNLPKAEEDLKEYIADTHKLSQSDTDELLSQSEGIGFIDHEKLDSREKFYFNGNLFRKDIVNKTNAVLSSLGNEDVKKIGQINEQLEKHGCVSIEAVQHTLGKDLYGKLIAIGMYDQNEVSNAMESQVLITRPSAFSKFGDPFEEDALDLAKAFVSSLYYGMKYSTQGRGQIQYLKALMRKLINGYEVGPATAIGEDYKILEFKRVVQLRRDGKSSMYYMKLLKKDIGIIALQVLETGEAASDLTVPVTLHSGSVSAYSGPEHQRGIVRKKQTPQSRKLVGQMIKTFRA